MAVAERTIFAGAGTVAEAVGPVGEEWPVWVSRRLAVIGSAEATSS